jgi:hypothetical protein
VGGALGMTVSNSTSGGVERRVRTTEGTCLGHCPPGEKHQRVGPEVQQPQGITQPPLPLKASEQGGRSSGGTPATAQDRPQRDRGSLSIHREIFHVGAKGQQRVQAQTKCEHATCGVPDWLQTLKAVSSFAIRGAYARGCCTS